MPWRDAPHLAALQLPYAPEVQTAQHPNVQPISAVAAVASAIEMEALEKKWRADHHPPAIDRSTAGGIRRSRQMHRQCFLLIAIALGSADLAGMADD